MEPVVCDLCGANNPRPYLTTTDRFTGSIFTFTRCSQCQLVYLNPRPSKAELEEHYPNDYEAYRLPEQYGSATENWHALQALAKQLNYVESYLPERGLLLDVGCATGNFLHFAQNHGWKVQGLEIVEKAAQIARKQFGIDVITSDLEGAHLPKASLDVVTLWDVLEHLTSPVGDMQRIHELLRPGGLIFFSIPNLDSYDRRLFGPEWIGWDAPRHFTLFDTVTINRLIVETGFELVDQRCLLGGRGTFLLSIDRIRQKKPILKWLRSLYPIISLLSWPYRQYAYLRQRGPIMYYTVRKVSV
jgi:SAM-dependent methyltransferase